MAARPAPRSAANSWEAGALARWPSTHACTRTSTDGNSGSPTTATPAPAPGTRQGRAIGTPAAHAASSRRVGPSKASRSPSACGVLTKRLDRKAALWSTAAQAVHRAWPTPDSH
jgi:hypothetical protein